MPSGTVCRLNLLLHEMILPSRNLRNPSVVYTKNEEWLQFLYVFLFLLFLWIESKQVHTFSLTLNLSLHKTHKCSFTHSLMSLVIYLFAASFAISFRAIFNSLCVFFGKFASALFNFCRIWRWLWRKVVGIFSSSFFFVLQWHVKK